MFGKEGAALRKLLILTALPLLLAACSGTDETSTGPSQSEIVLRPISADHWPMEDGNSWTYLRRLKTDEEIFPRINYQDYDVQVLGDIEWSHQTPLDFLNSPYIHIEVDGTGDGPEGLAQVLRGTRSSEPDGSGSPVNLVELWIDADNSRIRYTGENAVTAIDSLFWGSDQVDPIPFDWLKFGQLRWETLVADFSGEEGGMVSFGEALGLKSIEGFGRHRDFDHDTPVSSDGLPSDMANRFWPDSLISVSLVHEVVGMTDANYDSMFGFQDLEFFPELADTVFENCIWVLQSVEYEMHLTNQRNPDAGPGESGIPEVFIPDRVRRVTVKQPRRQWLLAPDLGPIEIVTYHDIELFVDDVPLFLWEIEPAEMTETELRFTSDFEEYDYLMDSSLLH